ncbi:hypothetical protein WJX74_009892 [Apatococcus lobatus]|uniref:Uncharacterized protein n=1 Tax=Apatococcus lobatus TaxID=904363 RepID=A0AAW1RZI4_9CHLO
MHETSFVRPSSSQTRPEQRQSVMPQSSANLQPEQPTILQQSVSQLQPSSIAAEEPTFWNQSPGQAQAAQVSVAEPSYSHQSLGQTHIRHPHEEPAPAASSGICDRQPSAVIDEARNEAATASPVQMTGEPQANLHGATSTGTYFGQLSVANGDDIAAAAPPVQMMGQPSPAISDVGSAATATSPLESPMESPFASTGQQEFGGGRRAAVFPSQEPMTREESQALGFKEPPTDHVGHQEQWRQAEGNELTEAQQRAFTPRLAKLGSEAQAEVDAMNAQEAEARENPPIALGPNPIPLSDLPPGVRLPGDENPIQFYFKRKGYNDFLIYDGACGGAFKRAKGDIVYYGDVAAKVMGWDITLRKGSNKHGKPLLHIGKSAKLWDKNTKVIITDATQDQEYTPSDFQTSLDGMSVLGSTDNQGLNLAEQYSSEGYAEEPARPGIATEPGQLQPGPRNGCGGLEGQPPDLTSPSMRGPPIHSSVSSMPLYARRSVRDPRPVPEDAFQKPSNTGSTGSSRPSRAGWLPGMSPGSLHTHVEPAWTENATRKEKAGVIWNKSVDYVKSHFVSVSSKRGPKPLAILRHVHELRGNENEFDYNGRRYCWNWHRFLGGQHTLTDMDSKEVVAVGKLHFTFAWQWVTAWGFRLNGTLTITGKGKEFVDIIVAGFIANLEWRKHNNKIWQIIIWTAA